MSAVVLTDRVLAQRAEALAHANEVRLAQYALKERIRAGGRPGAAIAARVLVRNPSLARSLEVGELLLCVWRLGKPTIRKLLERRRISPWCPIDEIPEHKRRALAHDLLAYARGEKWIGVRS